MEKKNNGKKSLGNLLLLLFFVIGAILILNDLSMNVMLEVEQASDTVYGYTDPNYGSGGGSADLQSSEPTPTVDPILTEFNQ